MRATTALILETNNLRGITKDSQEATAHLFELLSHLRAQTWPLSQLVITHDGLSAKHQEQLASLCAHPVRFVEIDEQTDYYQAKNRGFDATDAELVAFGDADCWPSDTWLESLFSPLLQGAQVVAGRTTYRDAPLEVATSALDFLYIESPLREGAVRNFYANNVAFRRQTFATYRYQDNKALYRGQCLLVGLRLLQDQIPIWFAPEAKTLHRFPESIGEFIRWRMHRGGDTAALAPTLFERHAPSLSLLTKLGPLGAWSILAARLSLGARSFHQQGAERLRGVSYGVGLGCLVGVSLLDSLGAMCRPAPH